MHRRNAVEYISKASSLCLVLKRRLLEILRSVSGSVLLLAQLRLSRGFAIDTAVLLSRLLRGIRSSVIGLGGLILQSGDFFLGLDNVLK